jgi:hypothetical protein
LGFWLALLCPRADMLLAKSARRENAINKKAIKIYYSANIK